MANAPNAWTQFIAELKRRRVFRVAGAYLAAAFVVLQFADYLLRGLALPEWAFRLVVVLVVLGFIVAVPLAWAYDIGPGGIQRTPPSDQVVTGEPADGSRVRWWPVVAGLAVLALAAGGWLVLHGRQPAANPRRVVVAAFENQTGEAALAPLGNMAADWITQGLTRTGIVEVADAPTALVVARQASQGASITGADAVRFFSRETGAGLVVTGRYYRQADSLAFVAQVVDARTGQVLRAIGPLSAPAARPVQGAERLRQRLMAELAVLLDDRLARFQALEREPPSYDAYREYMDGLARYLARDSSAVDHFARAFALDTSLYPALLWTAQSTWAFAPVGFRTPLERYDSLLAHLDGLRPLLTPAEQYQLDFVRALRAADPRAAYAAARLRWEAAPGSDDALRELAISAYRVQHFREAAELLARADPDRGLLRRWTSEYWGYTGVIQHVRGDFEGELRSAAEWARRDPDALDPYAIRLEALAGLGRTEEVRAIFSRLADRLANSPEWWSFGAQELSAHGKTLEAQSLARDGMARCAGLAAAQLRYQSRLGCANLLGFLGRWRDADSLLRGLRPPAFSRVVFLGYAGVAAARSSERARASAFGDTLSRLPMRTLGDTYALFDVEYARAMVAAALGDREEALRRLRLWRAAGGWVPVILHREPVFLPYFSDPRFRELLKSED